MRIRDRSGRNPCADRRTTSPRHIA